MYYCTQVFFLKNFNISIKEKKAHQKNDVLLMVFID
jgi:hypothetical protein